MKIKPNLNEIATQVEDIIISYPKVCEDFKEHVQVLAKAFEKYYEAKSDEPQPYDDPTGKKKKEGFEYDENLQAWFPVNAPELPPNPTKWFEMKDKLPCYYTTLALIYDLEKSQYADKIMPDRIKGLKHYKYMVGFMQRYLTVGSEPFTQEGLGTALKQVNADLKKRAETGQKNKNTKNNIDLETLPAEAPPLLKYIKWIYLHGLKHWKILGVAVLIIIAASVIKKHLSVGGNEIVDDGTIISSDKLEIDGDYVSGDKIVNQGLSESDLEIVTRVAITQAAQLAKVYPIAHAVFGIYQGKLVVPKGLMPENLEIDWDTGKFESIDNNMLKVELPSIILNGSSIISGNITFLEKRVGARTRPIIKLIGFNPILEVIGIDGDLVTVALGFPTDD